MSKGLKCFNCGKGVMYGQSHKHHSGVAGGRWKRRAQRTRKIFKPNLHVARIQFGNLKKTVRLCTKCLRLLRKTNKSVEVTQKVEEASQVAAVSA